MLPARLNHTKEVSMSLVRTKKQDPVQRIASIINQNEDATMLESFSGLIKDMIEIENIDDEIAKKIKQKADIEKNMYNDESRVMLSFFLAGLDSAQIASVGDKIKGRIGMINRLNQKPEDADSEKTEDAENTSDNK
jgi:hypothetical protein